MGAYCQMMRNELISHDAQKTSSAQQFYKEAATSRDEAARSSIQGDRDGWMKLAQEWTELAVAERGRISGGDSVREVRQAISLDD